MKAIILTYAPINSHEKLLLQETKIYKIALNQHAEVCCPDARIISDYILKDIVARFTEKVITVRDRSLPESKIVEYFDGEFKGATILAAIDYLLSKKYDEILIVGDNKVNNSQFSDLVNREIDKISEKVIIYQYTKGNFNLPVITIENFCEM